MQKWNALILLQWGDFGFLKWTVCWTGTKWWMVEFSSLICNERLCTWSIMHLVRNHSGLAVNNRNVAIVHLKKDRWKNIWILLFFAIKNAKYNQTIRKYSCCVVYVLSVLQFIFLVKSHDSLMGSVCHVKKKKLHVQPSWRERTTCWRRVMHQV